MKRNEEQLRQRVQEIFSKVVADNPFETFEPHPEEEGKHDIYSLYEARLIRLSYEAVLEGSDKELVHFLLRELTEIIKMEQQ